MQNELRRQISLLKREVEECELEEKQERNRKKNPNHELINTLAEYSQNHQRYIENIEIILRQLDNQIVSPYNVLDLIDGVDEYLKSYREEGFYLDDMLFEEFDLDNTSVDSEEDSTQEDALSDSTAEKAAQPAAAPAPVATAMPAVVPTTTPAPAVSLTPAPVVPAPGLTGPMKNLPVNSVWKSTSETPC